MLKRIVFTRIADNGVSICCPASEVIAWMGCGGFWDQHARGFIEMQIERQITCGVAPDVARRYAYAMQRGGCTTAEALAIIRDRDCAPYGRAIELWDLADVPVDYWFRNAWRRSHNGGPISIDLARAKRIQFQHARAAVMAMNSRLNSDMESFDRLVDIDWLRFRERIRSASDVRDLRGIWPTHLAVSCGGGPRRAEEGHAGGAALAALMGSVARREA
ncbi:hypothetical protein [Bradyrhizobium sp.]|uniref:hypothetical protein n=1 Tax=Bradyrhizobium sp. TaxID=376 RepID=UPI0025C2EC30|nr:hypothetical protein [Bradyrhizobium sp.]